MKSMKKRILCFGIIILLEYVLWNTTSIIRDHRYIRNVKNYSELLDIKNHTMSVNIKGESNENNESTIIILPGFGSASPIIEFQPLAEILSDQYKIITIEPFGYGMSDGIGEDRSLKNIVNELHSCIEELHIDKYYLMAHSIGGLYSLYWANKYPEEVLGFIGIDISVPGMEENSSYPLNMSIGQAAKYSTSLLRMFDTFGLTRLLITFNYLDLFYRYNIINIDEYYPYTEEEMRILKILSISRRNNKTLMKEGEWLDKNIKRLRNKKFPSNIPILNFISSDNVESDPYWETLHYDVMNDFKYNEVIVLKGQHYLHLDNKEIMSNKIKEWISFINDDKKYYNQSIILQKEKDILMDLTLNGLKEK